MTNMTVKVSIDRDGCVQCGNCYGEDCPDVFGQDDSGTSQINEKYRVGGDLAKGSVPDDLKACVAAAVGSCPTDVISME